jgi:nitroreductase
MEFMEVLGNRRTIRFFEPNKPVEREKIQVILEASNRSSRGINVDFCKSIVVYRDEISDSVRQRLKTPTTNVALDLAPVWIFFYGDMKYPGEGKTHLKELVDLGALPATHGWSHAYVDEVIWGNVIGVFANDPTLNIWFLSVECGLAICQALLTAFEEGLGAGLHAFDANVAKEVLKVPDHWFPMWMLLVGYPAEDPKAGGQRPRRPLGQNNFLGQYGVPFPEDPAVREKLKQRGLIQEPMSPDGRARKAEIRKLAERFGLPM